MVIDYIPRSLGLTVFPLNADLSLAQTSRLVKNTINRRRILILKFFAIDRDHTVADLKNQYFDVQLDDAGNTVAASQAIQHDRQAS